MKCENPLCENIVTEYTLKAVLKRHCSYKCRGIHNSLKSREKAQQTWLSKYGVIHPKKLEQTNIKYKQTCLKNHGVEHPMQLAEVKEKLAVSNLAIHGVRNVFQSEKIKEKSRLTNLERRGVEYPTQSIEVQEKTKKTMLARHGVENPMHSDTFKNKIVITNLSRYNSESHTNRHLSKEQRELCRDINWLKEQNITKTLEEIAANIGVNSLIISRAFKRNNVPIVKHTQSLFEKQVVEYVKSIYSNIISNDRQQIKPFELDIWFPDLNMAIECNGRYFHQDEQKEINKFNKCKEKGIDLHFIWDDEWNKDQENIKSHIYFLIFKK